MNHELGEIFFENKTVILYNDELYQCVQSSLVQLPVDFFTKYPHIKTFNGKSLGLKSVSRELFNNASSTLKISLDNNHLTGLIRINKISININLNDHWLFAQQNSRIFCLAEPANLITLFWQITKSHQLEKTRLRDS